MERMTLQQLLYQQGCGNYLINLIDKWTLNFDWNYAGEVP
jgi:hypothetical protein